MNQTFIYYMILFLIILITISNLVENYRYSPKKIKNILSLLFILQIIRSISLVVLALIDNQRYVSFLKYLGILELVYIPLLLILSCYTLLRSDKIKFSFFKFAPILLIVFYLGMISIFPPFFNVSWEYGYIITTEKYFCFKSIYVILLILILSSLILFKKEKHSDRKGINCLLITMIAIVIENLMGFFKISFLNANVTTELILCFLCFYIVFTFKKNRVLING